MIRRKVVKIIRKKLFKGGIVLGNKNSKKTDILSEKTAREFAKVNMEDIENMGMPGIDKKRKPGKTTGINQFR